MIKLLLIEENCNFRVIIQTSLEEVFGGYKIAVGDNGEEGLRLWKEFQPDIIVVDLEMPVMDGYQMIKRIRKKDKKIPIILVSPLMDSKRESKGRRAGANCFLSKPFWPEVLMDRINSLLTKNGYFDRAEEIDTKSM